MGKSEVVTEGYTLSPEERKGIVDYIISELRAMPEAAEYIVLQAASALKLDFRRKRFIDALKCTLGPGSLTSASDYFRVIHREGGYFKLHIRQASEFFKNYYSLFLYL